MHGEESGPPLRVACVGMPRARAFFPALRALPGVTLAALCDVDPAALAAAGKTTGVERLYRDYAEMLERERPDAVLVATPMQHHAEQATQALARDIHVLSEVTAAVTLDQAQRLVRACARSRAVYMMAENYLYSRRHALVTALVQAGLFGDVYYAEGEYIHELSALHSGPNGRPTWRARWQVGINGATYATHSLGPCLEWTGGRPARIACMGSGRHTTPPRAMEETVLLLCKTGDDKLIRVRLDMLSRRPHAMTNYTLQGTGGAYESARRPGEGDWVWSAQRCRDPETWLPLESFAEEFLPAHWRTPPDVARRSGHGGGDYFVVRDFVRAAQGLCPPAVDIHRAMDLTLPGLISQESIAQGGAWLPVPDSRAWVA